MTAYELRRHLAQHHDVRMVGADWGTLQTVHGIEHRPGVDQDHDHNDASAAGWVRDCAEFGCGEEAH